MQDPDPGSLRKTLSVSQLLRPSRPFWKRPACELLGARQGLEPLGDLVEALLAGGLGEPGYIWVYS
jgi:hypothetical protein